VSSLSGLYGELEQIRVFEDFYLGVRLLGRGVVHDHPAEDLGGDRVLGGLVEVA